MFCAAIVGVALGSSPRVVAAGSAGCPVVMQQPPTTVSTCPRGHVDLTLVASGDPPLTYEWQYQGPSGEWRPVEDSSARERDDEPPTLTIRLYDHRWDSSVPFDAPFGTPTIEPLAGQGLGGGFFKRQDANIDSVLGSVTTIGTVSPTYIDNGKGWLLNLGPASGGSAWVEVRDYVSARSDIPIGSIISEVGARLRVWGGTDDQWRIGFLGPDQLTPGNFLELHHTAGSTFASYEAMVAPAQAGVAAWSKGVPLADLQHPATGLRFWARTGAPLHPVIVDTLGFVVRYQPPPERHPTTPIYKFDAIRDLLVNGAHGKTVVIGSGDSNWQRGGGSFGHKIEIENLLARILPWRGTGLCGFGAQSRGSNWTGPAFRDFGIRDATRDALTLTTGSPVSASPLALTHPGGVATLSAPGAFANYDWAPGDVAYIENFRTSTQLPSQAIDVPVARKINDDAIELGATPGPGADIPASPTTGVKLTHIRRATGGEAWFVQPWGMHYIPSGSTYTYRETEPGLFAAGPQVRHPLRVRLWYATFDSGSGSFTLQGRHSYFMPLPDGPTVRTNTGVIGWAHVDWMIPADPDRSAIEVGVTREGGAPVVGPAAFAFIQLFDDSAPQGFTFQTFFQMGGRSLLDMFRAQHEVGDPFLDFYIAAVRGSDDPGESVTWLLAAESGHNDRNETENSEGRTQHASNGDALAYPGASRNAYYDNLAQLVEFKARILAAWPNDAVGLLPIVCHWTNAGGGVEDPAIASYRQAAYSFADQRDDTAVVVMTPEAGIGAVQEWNSWYESGDTNHLFIYGYIYAWRAIGDWIWDQIAWDFCHPVAPDAASPAIDLEIGRCPAPFHVRCVVSNPCGEVASNVTSIQVSECPGDADASFSVGLSDVAAIIRCWGQPATCNPCADLDDSESIGIGDLAEVVTQWASSCP
ncbi:MAG TPA: hypothetical protein VG797_01125 [Phycisphaerales bacterium]|nr:hypothetical protein [Phycisphaerales bacterium]